MKRSPADIAFSNAFREYKRHTCERCGKQGRTELSHVHSRRHRTIRWDVLNAVSKCHTCHRWWHENPTESGVWFRKTFGDERADILLEKKNMKIKVPKSEEKEIAKWYREQLKLLESDPTHELESYQ